VVLECPWLSAEVCSAAEEGNFQLLHIDSEVRGMISSLSVCKEHVLMSKPALRVAGGCKAVVALLWHRACGMGAITK
jgi:hypothetical protein